MSRAQVHSASARPEAQALPAAIVDAFQRDLLRVAFALTGENVAAAALVRAALVDVLTGSTDEEVDPNAWSRLLLALGREYLAGVDAGPLAEPEIVDDVTPSPAQRERARLREALLLLTRPMRTALVLRDLGGLHLRDAELLTGFEPDEFEPMLDWSRERVREAVGGLVDESPQRLLSTLAVDAPRLDLWPEIRPAIEAHEAGRRARNRRIIATTAALALAGMLATAVWFLGGLPALGFNDEPSAPVDDAAVIPLPRPTRPPLPTPTSVELIDAALPGELQLVGELRNIRGDSTGEQALINVDLNTGTVLSDVTVQDPSNGIWSYSSPDGRWSVLQRSHRHVPPDAEEPDEAPSLPVLSVARDGVELDWEFVVPQTSYYDSWDSAVLGDRLYVAYAPQRAPSIVVLDLETGDVIETVSLDLPFALPEPEPGESSPSVNVRLFPFADAAAPQLYAVVTTDRRDAAIRQHVSRSIFRIHLDESRAELLDFRDFESGAAGEPVPADLAPYSFLGADILPDGSGLFYVRWGWAGFSNQVGVVFLDFASGDVETIETVFALPQAESEQGFNFVTLTSNDGRHLYIISNDNGEVAVVDLVGRRIERTFPLDLGGVASGPVEARSAHLSHDGSWMYLVGAAWWHNQQPPEQTPVWVVDMTTWRLVKRIDMPGYIQSLYPDPNGERLYVLAQVKDREDPQRWSYQFISYETERYATADVLQVSNLVEQNASFQLVAASESYRLTYGRTPMIDGIAPGDVAEYTTLPRVRVVTQQEQIPVDVTAPIELEFLEPASGDPLNGPDPRVRYDPDEPVLLVFEQPGAKSLITVTAEIASGQLAGSVRLKALGFWDARIVVGDGERDGYTVFLPDVIRSAPTFAGDNGRPYSLRLETDPAEPISAGEIAVRASFVDAATGDPLPESVTLIDGIPDEMRIVLTGPGSADFSSGDLALTGHGVYEGTITLEQPGAWRTRLIFVQPESAETRATQIDMGDLEIVAAQPLDDSFR